MKYFFNKEDKEANKIIQLTDDIKWEDICNTLEEVDMNGNEKENEDNFDIKAEEEKTKEKEIKDVKEETTTKKKKKKKH